MHQIFCSSLWCFRREPAHRVGLLGVRECLFNQLKIPLENPQGRTELEMQSRNREMTMRLCV